jgi:hypothetical protein
MRASISKPYGAMMQPQVARLRQKCNRFLATQNLSHRGTESHFILDAFMQLR